MKMMKKIKIMIKTLLAHLDSKKYYWDILLVSVLASVLKYKITTIPILKEHGYITYIISLFICYTIIYIFKSLLIYFKISLNLKANFFSKSLISRSITTSIIYIFNPYITYVICYFYFLDIYPHMIPSSRGENLYFEYYINMDNVIELAEAAKGLHICNKFINLSSDYINFLRQIENGNIDLRIPNNKAIANAKISQFRSAILASYVQGRPYVPESAEVSNIFRPPRVNSLYKFDNTDYDLQVYINMDLNKLITQRDTMEGLKPTFKEEFEKYREKVKDDFKSIINPEKNISDSQIEEAINDKIKKSRNQTTSEIVKSIGKDLGL
jgi:hypothetical protein